MTLEEKVRLIAARLRDYYGEINVQKRDPLTTLISTILSQNTNDANCDRAYASLLERFGSLDAVKDAPSEEIAAAIRIGGLHRQKGARIKEVLERIAREQGSLDLNFLSKLPLEEAMNWLLSLPGVGKKTAGVVLLFSFQKPYFPVDTHIKRVTRRLGLLAPQGDPHDQLNPILPKDSGFMGQLHLHMIRLGRDLCHPRRPECGACPLLDVCENPPIDLARR